MNNNIRKFDPKKDRKAIHRIWQEIGWLDKGNEKVLDLFLEACTTWVSEVDNSAEVTAATSPGKIRYKDEDLDFSGVMAVTCSRIARKQGLATYLTAHAVARAAEAGAAVSGLGIFEQGFYNKLGYGNGGYEHFLLFDPANLKIKRKIPPPKRITADHYKKVHRSRIQRMRLHGGIYFRENTITAAEMKWAKKGFGLGYYDPSGKEITHHVWLENRGGEHGPYSVSWMSYRNYDQFLDLMAILKTMEDQVRLIGILEPVEIQLQDFLSHPFRYRISSEKSKYENTMRSASWYQIRICDLKKAIRAIKLESDDILEFNLELHDPITEYLDTTYEWCGIGGRYTVSLGRKSSVKKGFSKALPVLRATVNNFTRLWLGVKPATGLAVTDDLEAEEQLLQKLNRIFALPRPRPDWEF